MTDAFQFGFLIAALVQQCFTLLIGQVSSLATFVTFQFVTSHQSLESVDFIGHYLSLFLFESLQLNQFGRLLQPLHLMVDSGNFGLTLLELALGVEQVIDGRDEIVVHHAARKIA